MPSRERKSEFATGHATPDVEVVWLVTTPLADVTIELGGDGGRTRSSRTRRCQMAEISVRSRTVALTPAMSSVRLLLHAEGLAAFIAGVALFGWAGGQWLWLVPLLFVPDLSMIGYASGSRVGSHVYNAVHNWALGLAVLGAGLWLVSTPLVIAGAVLVAHVGFDRALGYGLKYPTGFRDTHVSRA